MTIDPFTRMAACSLEKSVEDVTPDERRLALRFYFGYIQAVRFHHLEFPAMLEEDWCPVVFLDRTPDGRLYQRASTDPVMLFLANRPGVIRHGPGTLLELRGEEIPLTVELISTPFDHDRRYASYVRNTWVSTR